MKVPFQRDWSAPNRLIGFTALLICSNGNAQYFNKTYDLATSFTDLFNSSVLMPDTNILVQGLDYRLDGSIPVTFTKVNSQTGDTIWHKKDGQVFDKHARANGRPHLVYDNFIYSCGNYYDTLSRFLPYVYKLDLNGNIVWKKYFNDMACDYSVFHSMCVANDGNLIFTGSKELVAGNPNFYLVKTDTSGNIIWEKYFGNSNSEAAYTVDLTLDGGFYLAGYRQTSPTAVDGYLVKTDSMGNFQWQKLTGNLTAVWGRTLTDGNLLVYGGIKNSNPSETDAYLAIIDDTSNTLLNSKTFVLSDSSDNVFIDAVQIQDNLYLTGGCWQSDVNNITGLFFKSNLQLDSVLFKTYSVVPSENALYSILAIPDGGFVMTGFVAPSVSMSTTQDGWMVRVDSLGCESVSCALTVDEPTYESLLFNLYPNPANNFVRLEFEGKEQYTILIYNLYGELVQLNANFVSGNKLDLNSLTNGMYLICLKDQGKIRAQKKLIISR